MDFLKKHKKIAKIQAETNNLEKTNSTCPLSERPIFTKAKDVPQKKNQKIMQDTVIYYSCINL